MALPTVVLDALNSLNIASLPPQVNAGDQVNLGLKPGLEAFDFLTQPPKLFDIEINNIILDNIGVELTDISLEPVGAPGQERFQLTLDANNAPGSAPGTTDLEVVGGLASQITGTVRQVEKFAGSITGTIGTIGGHINGRITGTIQNLKGSVKAPKLLESPPEVSLKWKVEDGSGKELTENTDYVMLGNTTLTNPAASLMFLPVFAELSAGVDLISRRRIFCDVKVTVGTEEKTRKLGPVDILLPKIQLPTILVMADNVITPGGNPGAVLVAVPSQSLLTLDQLSDKLRAVEAVLNRLKDISQFAGFDDTVKELKVIIELIANPNIRTPSFLKQDGVMDLWYVMREPGGFLNLSYKSWEDCITGLIMIGPPGRAARFYNAKDFWERLGAFEIVLGLKAVGRISDLTPSTPTCEPTGDGGCTFRQRWDPPPPRFSNIISSYQFLPLQNP